MTILSLLAAWSWFPTRYSWKLDSCSELPPCLVVTTFTFFFLEVLLVVPLLAIFLLYMESLPMMVAASASFWCVVYWGCWYQSGGGCDAGKCWGCRWGRGCEGLMDKYRYATNCETSLMGVDIEYEGPLGMVSIAWCRDAGHLVGCLANCGWSCTKWICCLCLLWWWG